MKSHRIAWQTDNVPIVEIEDFCLATGFVFDPVEQEVVIFEVRYDEEFRGDDWQESNLFV